MDHFDPNKKNANGHPEIASHYMPLTGPYDSSDEAILEYQVLSMKIAGIDGVIVDWYGIKDFRDYTTVNRSTLALFEFIKKAGLTFTICYEDNSIKQMVNESVLTSEEALPHAQDVMHFMHEHWFTDAAYLKTSERPILLTFGPQYFKSSLDWEQIFAVIDPQPFLVTLDKHMVSGALASYPWPPMPGEITVNRAFIETYLTQFYRKARRWEYKVGGAFPAFHDIYKQAGVRGSFGYLDAEDGETFRFTLQLALEQDLDVIQLITWNDYGEGTIIEPTHEFGYRYLEMVQDAKRGITSEFTFSSADLNLPLQLYNLRKQNPDSKDVNTRLDRAFEAIVAGDTVAAQMLIDGK